MIPLRNQELIRQRFQRDLKSRVRLDFFTRRRSALLVPGREDCPSCEEVQTLLGELASLSERIALTVHDLDSAGDAARSLAVDKVPATVIRGQANRAVRYFGLPSGSQFVGFVETLIEAASGAVALPPETARRLRKLRSEVALQVFVTPACPYSPPLALTALRFGLANPRLKVDVVEATEFPSLSQRLGIRAVPTMVINDRAVLRGGVDAAALLEALLQVVEGRQAAVDLGRQGPMTPIPEIKGQSQPATSGGIILPR